MYKAFIYRIIPAAGDSAMNPTKKGRKVGIRICLIVAFPAYLSLRSRSMSNLSPYSVLLIDEVQGTTGISSARAADPHRWGT